MPTKNTAKVKVTNHATAFILSVTIGHKYSDVYKNTHTFENIADGSSTADSFTVEFNTGLTTTGRDWWIVNWIQRREENGEVILEACHTDPTNFRGVIDFSEYWSKVGLDYAKIAALKAGVVAAPVSGASSVAAGIAAAATLHLTGMSMNSESTDGYKQHILRESDVRDGVEILIANNGRVLFKSASGESETTYERRKL